MNRWILACLLLAASRSAIGNDLAILPPRIVLDGPKGTARVIVVQRDGETVVQDVTPGSVLQVEDPAVAELGPDGTIAPRGDGRTTLIAIVDGQRTTAEVVVRKFQEPFDWSFRNHVLPVLTKAGCNSGACHGAAAGKGGLKLTLRGYAPEVDYDVLTRQSLGRRIRTTAPNQSLFLLKPTAAVEHGGGLRLIAASEDYRVLAEWIAAGIPAPRDDDPTLTAITPFPAAVRLDRGERQQLIVQAAYSDGRVEDVTRWAKFASNDDGVARVDESGAVTVTGSGQGIITVWFNNLVQLVTVVSPYPGPTDEAAFAAAARINPIDDLNLEKLRALNLPPSGACDDATFLRRASLDATGMLPTREAVEAFLADPDLKKRSLLVDRLLASDAYVDYWAYRWSDVLLVSSKKLPAPAMWAFSRWIRKAVASNTPWDQFARSLITARGSTLQNGAANYFALHRDPIDLTESATVAFLGLSMTCARCHNHPLEKWTQDQYYGLANLFGRVKLKDGERGAGDIVVTIAAEGDIVHPRRGVPMRPQPLDGQALPLDARGDRREAFADWLADPANPYFDRAVISRVWRNFFGRGLVEPEDDLRATNPPTDPALMDWLVQDFREHGRDLKHLMRTIMNSGVYNRTSNPAPGNEADTKFLSHYLPERLPAEVLLDGIAQVAGVPSTFSGYPAGWRSLQLPDVQVANSFLESFGRPERIATCSCERSSEPSLAQALHLANGTTVNDKLRSDDGILPKLIEGGKTDDEIVTILFTSALARRPTDQERRTFTSAVAESVASAAEDDARKTLRRQALEDLFWAVLTSEEFMFNH